MSAYQTRIFWIDRPGGRLFAVLYEPESVGPRPTVIISHGLGLTHTSVREYAEPFASMGLQCLIFDFADASNRSKSGTQTTKISIRTLERDLEAVFSWAEHARVVDNNKIFLMGQSIGGATSALVAAAHPKAIKGLILFFPAFSVGDEARARFGDEDGVPGTFEKFDGRVILGRRYAIDAMSVDFSGIGAFEGDVLIVHGDADERVPLRYSQRAASDEYQSASLVTVPGAGHRFTGDNYELALQATESFLLKRI